MIVLGCDIGSTTAKAVLLKDQTIIAGDVIKAQGTPAESAKKIIETVLNKTGLAQKDIRYCVGTGYGKDQIPCVDERISEIACHAKAAKWLDSRVSTVIDIGGQDCKVIKVDKRGDIDNFATNDKCASGTGRFLEVMSKLLNINIERLGMIPEPLREDLQFSSTCTVWVQQEVIHYLNNGKFIEDIGAAVNLAIAGRVASLVKRLGLKKEVFLSGGVAKNIGVRKNLEKKLGIRIKKSKHDPQIIGALGAALFARENLR